MHVIFDVNIVEYPKKTVYLQDIADVEYIVLETHEDGLINGDLNHVTDSLIIVKNGITDNVVFFHRNGKYSHSFNRKGPSEKEYSSMSDICVNTHLKEIYINDFSRSMIRNYVCGSSRREIGVCGKGIASHARFGQGKDRTTGSYPIDRIS